MQRTIFWRTLILSFLFLPQVWAQFPVQGLINPINPNDSLNKEVHLNIFNLNFVRNYEYSNNFHDGYTLYGTQLAPQLVYFAHPQLSLSAGAYMRKDFGARGISDVQPLFQLKYKKNDLSLIFGSIEGNVQHGYIEPLYNTEKIITEPVSYGTQLRIDRQKWELNTWIAWQKMIHKGEAAKEEIVGGFTTAYKADLGNDWKLKLPLQMLFYHQGGQIDVLKDIPLTTLGNGAIGFRLGKSLGYRFKEIYVDNHLVWYKDFSPEKRRAFQGGYGIWLNAGLETSFGHFLASYWKGNRFITIKGMPLYQSVSENLYESGFTQTSRNVLALRYAYQKELLPNLFLDVRLEPHIDLDHRDKQLQFNHSFFLSYRHSFKLFKAK